MVNTAVLTFPSYRHDQQSLTAAVLKFLADALNCSFLIIAVSDFQIDWDVVNFNPLRTEVH